MPSARVRVSHDFGLETTCRVLLDTCASANLLTEKFARLLNAPKTRCSLTIGAVNELSTVAKFCTRLTVKSLYSDFSKQLTFFIVPSITETVPSEAVSRDEIEIPRNIKLADPEFHKPSGVDMLLGAGPTLSLFCVGQIKLSPEEDLILQKTRLGWIVGGGARASKTAKPSRCMLSNMSFDLEKFWSLEEVADQVNWSSDEIRCEEFFKSHVYREKNGQYVVALPFKKPQAELGESRQVALKRLHSLQIKFRNDKEYERKYTEVMNDYLRSGHMSPSKSRAGEGFYLPHHAVRKETSHTTKLRVVFDASAKSSNRLSLNDNLLIGPTIQDDLFSILLRFRKHRYVVIADIEKMYRQFLVRPEDREYQKILWLNGTQIREYTLNTVTFGVASAPFLAIRSLHQLCEDEGENYPLATQVLKRDMYVDNMLTGANSKSKTRELCDQMSRMLKTAGMKMRQWASNEPSILEKIDRRDFDVDFSFDENSSLKTLGIFWKARTDRFVYKVNEISTAGKITKRAILSEIAKIFDPIGLLGPVKLYAKKIMQELWHAEIDWDESVPSDIFHKWREFCKQLSEIKSITFDRHVFLSGARESEIHGFCDASQDGYGACLYLRSRNAGSTCQVSLLCSKSRVAPLKTQTIPRLELCAMLLLANLYQQTAKALDTRIDSTYFWSDSSIALNWINTPSNKLKTFVSNRVAAIQSKTNVRDWRHVRSSDNPADGLSRGQLPREFRNNHQWQHGPAWLQRDKKAWPKSEIPGIETLPEERKITCLLANSDATKFVDKFANSSSIIKLIRAIAYCVRLIKKYKRFDPLSSRELERAERTLISVLQTSVFRDEYRLISNGKPLPNKNQLVPLDPFIDDHGIMRVGGRLCRAMIPFSSRHPIILPKGHHLTKLIISYQHEENHHAGVQNAQLRDLAELLQSDDLNRKVTRYATAKGIEWHFIPPRAPNFGGLWEAAVKQFKHHLVRVASDKRFTYAQFTTFCREVEAILNSRPLTPMSDDVNDLQALTAGHFLTGRSMNSLPERDYQNIPTNRLKAWEQITKLKQQFWSRWHREYLNNLMVRQKQRKKGPEIKVGMLALIKEDDLPCMQWPMGRITKLIPGADGHVRTVIVATKMGPKTRPVTRLAILPFSKGNAEPAPVE